VTRDDVRAINGGVRGNLKLNLTSRRVGMRSKPKTHELLLLTLNLWLWEIRVRLATYYYNCSLFHFDHSPRPTATRIAHPYALRAVLLHYLIHYSADFIVCKKTRRSGANEAPTAYEP
jgi:hypothetical protein